MKKCVRVGRVQDQDGWRRDDLRAMTPSERVDMALQLQADYLGDMERSLERTARVRKLGRG